MIKDGQKLRDHAQQRHDEKMAELQRTIDELNQEYLGVKAANQAAEKNLCTPHILLTGYENADKQCTGALESYDQEMRERNKERDET